MFFSPPIIAERRNMDYIEKIEKLETHLMEHPSDCQAVISLLKTRSKAIEHRDRQMLAERLKRISEIKHGKQTRK